MDWSKKYSEYYAFFLMLTDTLAFLFIHMQELYVAKVEFLIQILLV